MASQVNLASDGQLERIWDKVARRVRECRGKRSSKGRPGLRQDGWPADLVRRHPSEAECNPPVRQLVSGLT